MKTSMNIKVDVEVRDKAKNLFGKLGLDMTTAVNMFLLASIREKGIPFAVSAVSKQDEIDKIIASKLRIAEEQEKTGQMESFDEFAVGLKNKYGI